jgi:hypothetical protein
MAPAISRAVSHDLLMTLFTYELEPLSSTAADLLRANGGISYTAESKPGYPCRQCLRDAEIGEELLLVSYDPFATNSPYRSASPILIHSAACTPDRTIRLPEQLTIRQLSVRAFDEADMMIDASVTEGADLDSGTASNVFGHKHQSRARPQCRAWLLGNERRASPLVTAFF